MKKLVALAFVMVLAGAATAQARVDLSVNIGIPVAAPPPVVYPAPAPVAYAEPPSFIYSPNLGFYVSVGLPYDVVYTDNCYYQYREGYWYMATSYRGPWTYVAPRRLPYGLHQHRYEQIRYYRDHEYRTYLSDRDRYRGNWYRPVAERRDGRWGERKDYYRDGYRSGYRDANRDERRDDHRDDRRDDRRDDHRDYRDRH
ncbi:hypothetical protein [Geomonas propionica]|uniref:YXWGXW repeat-containing protein n=1 Tax=Geomonas propionica TaxID=2798582 RepID=A0ABS0YSL8_9BACT|nr:hypothetical protein [Geomonas propionica]MBJ6800452.1 hypothetical protein [Geomonas propionica]